MIFYIKLLLCPAKELNFHELAFTVGHTAKENTPILTLSQRELYLHPPFGYTTTVHIAITENHHVKNMLSSKFQSGMVGNDEEMYDLCESLVSFPRSSIQVLIGCYMKNTTTQ